MIDTPISPGASCGAEPPKPEFRPLTNKICWCSSFHHFWQSPNLWPGLPHGDIEKRPAWRRGNPSHIDIAPLHWQLVGPSTRLGTGTATSPLGPILRDSHDMTCVTCPCLSCFLICWEVSDLFPLWVRLRLSCACFNLISSRPKPRSFSVANLTCVKYVRMIGSLTDMVCYGRPMFPSHQFWSPTHANVSNFYPGNSRVQQAEIPYPPVVGGSTFYSDPHLHFGWAKIAHYGSYPFMLAGIQYFESFIFVPVPAKINFWNVKSFIFASSSKFEQFQPIFWLFYVVLVGIPNHLWTSSSYFEHFSSILMEDVWQFFCFPGHLGE